MGTIEKEGVDINTPPNKTKRVDRKAIKSLNKYSFSSHEEIDKRLKELEEEWDIERLLGFNAAIISLTGLMLGVRDRRWLVLPAIVSGFLAQQAVQGWCPPVPFLRAIGFRTRQEIDQEKYALKALRGDFEQAYDSEDAWAAVKE